MIAGNEHGIVAAVNVGEPPRDDITILVAAVEEIADEDGEGGRIIEPLGNRRGLIHQGRQAALQIPDMDHAVILREVHRFHAALEEGDHTCFAGVEIVAGGKDRERGVECARGICKLAELVEALARYALNGVTRLIVGEGQFAVAAVAIDDEDLVSCIARFEGERFDFSGRRKGRVEGDGFACSDPAAEAFHRKRPHGGIVVLKVDPAAVRGQAHARVSLADVVGRDRMPVEARPAQQGALARSLGATHDN